MRGIVIAAVIVSVAGIGSVAGQHGPTRRKVVETIEIPEPVDKVWKILGDTEDETWMQDVATQWTQGGDPADSTRTLTLKNGRTITEKGRSYDAERRTFSYYITQNDVRDLPAGDYSATISVSPAGENRSTVEWKAAFYRGHPNNDPPPELNDENSEKSVRAWIHASLENLRKRVEKDRI